MVKIRIGCLHVQRNLWQTFLGRDIPKMRQMLHNFGPKLFRRHIGFKNDGTSYCKCCRKHAFESTQRPGKWPFLKPAFEPSCTLEKGALDFLVGLPWGQACMDSAPWQACWNPRSTHSLGTLSPRLQLQQRCEKCHQQVSDWCVQPIQQKNDYLEWSSRFGTSNLKKVKPWTTFIWFTIFIVAKYPVPVWWL